MFVKTLRLLLYLMKAGESINNERKCVKYLHNWGKVRTFAPVQRNVGPEKGSTFLFKVIV